MQKIYLKDEISKAFNDTTKKQKIKEIAKRLELSNQNIDNLNDFTNIIKSICQNIAIEKNFNDYPDWLVTLVDTYDKEIRT